MEKEITSLTTIEQYNKEFGFETINPQVSVIRFTHSEQVKPHKMNLGFYALFLKEGLCGEILYGRGKYDYQEGTVVTYAPGQIVGLTNVNKPARYASSVGILFAPEFIRGTSLGRRIKEYTFFSYSVNEALHLSDEEKKIVKECIGHIESELRQGSDSHSKRLIIANIELLLDYCMRFYERQFVTRRTVNKDVLVRFEELIDDYLQFHAQAEGLPSVAYFADKICLSANYFGDLIKKETGRSAIEYIQYKTIDTAKELLADSTNSISEIAYKLGYQYPQHFVRSFKKQVGCTPTAYRTQA